MGDPAGVGPEIAVKALSHQEVYKISKPLIIGDARVMTQALTFTRADIALRPVHDISEAKFEYGTIDVYDLQNVDLSQLRIGEVSAAAGQAAFEAVKTAIELAMTRKLDATVTGPIHKEALNLAGHRFSGHTEIYAHFTDTKEVAMLLVENHLRVIHVSTHVPLREACDLVKKDRILKVIQLLQDTCRQFGIASPRIGVAGLNPHASDGGLFGTEEAREISPAIAQARLMGIDAEGPVPPDTLFAKAKGGFYDGVVAMYHDQGHIPFKLQTFTFDDQRQVEAIRGVNITLGLPIIRTSVDHGTAFDIVGKGIARPDTLLDAIRYAAKMASWKR